MALLDHVVRMGKVLEMRLLGNGIVGAENVAFIHVKVLGPFPHPGWADEEKRIASVFHTRHTSLIFEPDGFSFVYSIPHKGGELRDPVAYLRSLKRKVYKAFTNV